MVERQNPRPLRTGVSRELSAKGGEFRGLAKGAKAKKGGGGRQHSLCGAPVKKKTLIKKECRGGMTRTTTSKTITTLRGHKSRGKVKKTCGVRFRAKKNSVGKTGVWEVRMQKSNVRETG